MKKSYFIAAVTFISIGFSAHAEVVSLEELQETCRASATTFGQRVINVSFVDVVGNTQNLPMVYEAVSHENGGCSFDNSNFFMKFRKIGNINVSFVVGFQISPEKIPVLRSINSDCIQMTTNFYINWYRSHGYTIFPELEAQIGKKVINEICPAKTKGLVSLMSQAFPGFDFSGNI